MRSVQFSRLSYLIVFVFQIHFFQICVFAVAGKQLVHASLDCELGVGIEFTFHNSPSVSEECEGPAIEALTFHT